MNMAGNLAAAACPVFVALLVTWTGSWDFLLFFFAGIYVAGAVCWIGIDPEGTIT